MFLVCFCNFHHRQRPCMILIVLARCVQLPLALRPMRAPSVLRGFGGVGKTSFPTLAIRGGQKRRPKCASPSLSLPKKTLQANRNTDKQVPNLATVLGTFSCILNKISHCAVTDDTHFLMNQTAMNVPTVIVIMTPQNSTISDTPPRRQA